MAERVTGLAVGAEVEVEVTGWAHGGLGVARHDGQVIFVAHAIPGERVRVRIRELGPQGRYLRADATEILTASAHRVTPPCPWAGPGQCGGCDLQHITLDHQRVLKAGVVREQLARLAHTEAEVTVEPLGSGAGVASRTRMEYAVDVAGRAGLRRSRSHDLMPIDECLLGVSGADGPGILDRAWPGASTVSAVIASAGPRVILPEPAAVNPPAVTERVTAAGTTLEFTVASSGFWQIHPLAPTTFVETVLGFLDPQPGDRVLDLYAGVGLFAAFLAEAVTPLGQVIAVESDPQACSHAKGNLTAYRHALVVPGRVDDLFGVPRPKRRGAAAQRASRPRRAVRSGLIPDRADLVVLDPPRSGAGPGVCRAVAGLSPRRIAYVACDPAALARDTASLIEAGFALAGVRAFDAFPMTHHVETIALFERRRP